MKNFAVRNFTILLLGMIMSTGCATIRKSIKGESYGTTITGVQHLGKDFSIREFYVDGYSGGGVGRGGGGGSYSCCVMMSEKWRKDLTVVVKWSVSNWKNADFDAIAREDYSSIKTDGNYIATVPIEEYGESGSLYVHFFPEGKVRAVVSMYGVFRGKYPISRDPNEKEKATQGSRVASIYDENLTLKINRK
jgi:hypothetical protein